MWGEKTNGKQAKTMLDCCIFLLITVFLSCENYLLHLFGSFLYQTHHISHFFSGFIGEPNGH